MIANWVTVEFFTRLANPKPAYVDAVHDVTMLLLMATAQALP